MALGDRIDVGWPGIFPLCIKKTLIFVARDAILSHGRPACNSQLQDNA